jgi:hypothetical protein
MARFAAGLVLALAATAPFAGTAATWPPITDPPTNTFVHGRWVWGELFTEDVEAAQRFYQALFGWTYQSLRAGEHSYTLALADGEPVGGMLQRTHVYEKDRGSRWVGMISVPDVAKAARYAEEHGGKVVVAPRALAGRGEIALLKDPEGAPFGVIRSAAGDPPDYRGEVNEWVWIELWAKDPQAMASFYGGLAGYETHPAAMAGGRSAYGLASGGYLRARIIPSPAAGQPTAWVPYLRVSDVKAASAAVAGAGGRVVVHPDRMIRDGKVALVIDPTGAAVGLAQISEGAR